MSGKTPVPTVRWGRNTSATDQKMELIAEPDSVVEEPLISEDGMVRAMDGSTGLIGLDEREGLAFFFAWLFLDAFLAGAFLATFLAGAFLAAFFLAVFLAGAFFATFLTVFLATAFFATFLTVFLATAFFATFLTVFLATAFFATLVPPGRRRAVVFLAAGFLLALRFIIAVNSAGVVTRL